MKYLLNFVCSWNFVIFSDIMCFPFSSDCIGSAFNVKGVMECPNCREIENGVWRCFENGSPGPDLYEGMVEEPVDFIDMVKAKTTYKF